MLFGLIIRAPPKAMTFPERPVSGATKGPFDLPEKGPHRRVKAELWAPAEMEKSRDTERTWACRETAQSPEAQKDAGNGQDMGLPELRKTIFIEDRNAAAHHRQARRRT